jgi:lycopene cyclase CruA
MSETQLILDAIKATHPLTHDAFSRIADGEGWIARIAELDRYWDTIATRPQLNVLRPLSKLPSDAKISGTFDLIYAGATLGLLHAAAMTKVFGKSVLVMDKYTPAKTHRDWNISRQELTKLKTIGLLIDADIEHAVTKTYRTGFVEFAAKEKPKKRLFIDNVLDCAVESDVILNASLRNVQADEKNQVLPQTSFQACYIGTDGVVVETERADGSHEFYKAKVFVDAMGVMSPVAMQLNGFRPQTHLCPTVGTLASGFENIDYDIGEILVSNEPATAGRQLIWEGFPASDTDFTSYLFFYDRVDSQNDKSLLNLFETYFQKLPTYKKPSADFKIHKPVFGIIPAFHHTGYGKTRETADDRVVCFGDAASLSSPLTFCGFGSMVRNLERTTSKLNAALEKNTLTKSDLDAISAFEPNVAIMSNLMKFMCYDASTDEPNFVNDLMNEIMLVLDELPERYRVSMFRDEMTFQDFTTLILTVGRRYPQIFEIAYRKLGIMGSVSWLQNMIGWAFDARK